MTMRLFDQTAFPALNAIVERMASEMPDDIAVRLQLAFGQAMRAIGGRLERGLIDATDLLLTVHEARLFSALANEDMAEVIRLITPEAA